MSFRDIPSRHRRHQGSLQGSFRSIIETLVQVQRARRPDLASAVSEVQCSKLVLKRGGEKFSIA